MLITKQDGSREEFDVSKLRRSLKRVGCSQRVCEEVIDEIKRTIHEGESTSKIYSHAFNLLKKKEKPLAARYSMKRAVLELGPSGFPFESFVAEIFKAQGYNAQTNKHITGICSPHEVDVYASREGRCIGAELKFHNRLGLKADLKVALYVQARFDDIKKAHPRGHVEGGVDEGWLITNTSFTTNAIDYGKCMGLTLIAWEHPTKGNLRDMIEETGVQPITALTTLSDQSKRLLLQRKIVLCRMLFGEKKALEEAGLQSDQIGGVLTEADALCLGGGH